MEERIIILVFGFRRACSNGKSDIHNQCHYILPRRQDNIQVKYFPVRSWLFNFKYHYQK